jgi:eukaryotic-like serine/threonine-protein kinase
MNALDRWRDSVPGAIGVFVPYLRRPEDALAALAAAVLWPMRDDLDAAAAALPELLGADYARVAPLLQRAPADLDDAVRACAALAASGSAAQAALARLVNALLVDPAAQHRDAQAAAQQVVIQIGDAYNISDIKGANVNIKSMLSQIEQRVGAAPELDDATRALLGRLITASRSAPADPIAAQALPEQYQHHPPDALQETLRLERARALLPPPRPFLRTAFVGVSLMAVVSITALILVVTLRSPNPVPYLLPVAFVFASGSIGIGIIQYRQSQPPPQLERNRRPLIARMLRWVTDQFEAALAAVLRIDVILRKRPDAVVQPYGDQVPIPPRPLDSQLPIVDVFEQLGSALLILGAPGSGKTTLLLELARDLLVRAGQDPRLPIPVVFKLSTWSAWQVQDRSPSLAEWLVHELVQQYAVPRTIAQALIDQDAVLPLLDGLDDVQTPNQRDVCAQAINLFRRQYSLLPLVVSCRTAEYEALAAKLQLQGAVEVQPLTDEQIDAYVAHLGEPLAGLRVALATNPTLHELAMSPLFLSIMAQVYRDVPAPALQPVDNAATAAGGAPAPYARLFAAYIDQMLQRQVEYPAGRDQLIRWLAYLARGMQRCAQPVFLIERLQPDWLPSAGARAWFAVADRLGGALVAILAVGTVAGLSYGLGNGLTHGLTLGLLAGLANGMRFGLVAGLVVGLLGATQSSRATSAGPRWAYVRRVALGVLIFGAAGVLFAELSLSTLVRTFDALDQVTWRDIVADALFFGLVGGLGAGALQGPSLRPRIVQVVEGRRWSWSRSLSLAIAVGVAVAVVSTFIYREGAWLVFGLVYGLSVWVILGLVTGEVEGVTRPNQGIWQSARSAMRVGLAIGLVGGVGGIVGGIAVGEPLFGIIYGISSAALVGLFGAFVSGGSACLAHVALRLALWRSGALPWDLTHFLDAATHRALLRPAGGGYTFIHRLMLEHVAGIDSAPATAPDAALDSGQPTR